MIRIDCQSQNEIWILEHILKDHPLIEYEIWLIHPITSPEDSHGQQPIPFPEVSQYRDWRDMHRWRKNGVTGTGHWKDHPSFFGTPSDRLSPTADLPSKAEALELVARFRKAYPELEARMRNAED